MGTAYKYTHIIDRYLCPMLFMAAFVSYMLFSHLMPITDPVESNYALTAKEMVVTSNWIAPQIYGKVWFDKPALIYWLLAASFKIFGFTAAAARIIPAFFSAASVAFIYWFISRIADTKRGLIAAAVLATSFQFMFMSKLVITDTLLFFFGNAAVAFFYLGYISFRNTKKWYLLLYPCMGLAVLTKGPVGLLLPGLIMFGFLVIQRKWSEIRNMYILPGLGLLCVVVLPWYVQMYSSYGSDFINNFFGVHNYLRATVSEHPKDNVFYFYPAVFLLGMLPWSGVALQGLYLGYKNLRRDDCTKDLFCLIWIAVYFVFYSLMATKYLTYTFPMLFPVAILTAEYINTLFIEQRSKTLLWWVGLPLTVLVLSYIFISYKYLLKTEFMISTLSVLLVMAVALWTSKRGKTEEIFKAIFCCSLSIFILLSATVAPRIANLRSGKSTAENLEMFKDYKVGIYNDYSTSAVFYSGNVLVRLKAGNGLTAQQIPTLDWSSKYTMPTETLDEFMEGDQYGQHRIIIVPKNRQQEFNQEQKSTMFKTLMENQDISILKADGR
jgi:4-amino-4-deoxy-L-arabinose transferase-like glycosyltransferase